MEIQILLSDRSFNAIDDITDLAGKIRWDYNRIGGCGGFSFTVPTRFCRETQLGGSFNVKIYARNYSTNAFDLWYQGRIENKSANMRGDDESITVTGMGYQSQLSDIYVDRDYSSTEVSAIVKDILDNDITPNTDITYSAGDISATGFTADTLEFNTDAMSAMQTLADIVGTREWGVDKDRKFFFKARSSSVGFRYPVGSKILNFSTDSSSKDIANRIIVTGGDVAGTTFTRTVNDPKSQTKWGRRDKSIQNSSIVTNSVADQFGDAALQEFKDIVRRARIELLDQSRVEATVPIPLLQVIPKGITYGTRKYGEFLYQGVPSYQIQRVSYRLDDESNLTTNIELGQLRPSIAENINQLEHQIEQLRSAGV